MNDILGATFSDIDPFRIEREGKTLAAVLGDRIKQATAALEGDSIGDPLMAARMQVTMGRSHQALEQKIEASEMFNKAQATMASLIGPDEPETLRVGRYLATGYIDIGWYNHAMVPPEAIIAVQRSKLGPDHPDTLVSLDLLAGASRGEGQAFRAVPLAEHVLAMWRTQLGPDHPMTMAILTNLAEAYQADGSWGKAISIFQELAEACQRRDGAQSIPYAGALAPLALALLNQEKWADAESVLRQCLSIRELKEADDWKTFNTMSILGAALLGQGRYDDAAPLLLRGYQGMQQRAAKIPDAGKRRPGEALDRLLKLAEATNKVDEAKAWREEKSRMIAPATPITSTPTILPPPAAEPTRPAADRP